MDKSNNKLYFFLLNSEKRQWNNLAKRVEILYKIQRGEIDSLVDSEEYKKELATAMVNLLLDEYVDINIK